MMPNLRDYLEDYALAIETTDGEILTACGRGVKPLYTLYQTVPAKLRGARLVDRVVGRGAAAIMVAAGIASIESPIISRSALDLLQRHGITVQAGQIVDMIVNRAGTGQCPVEALTSGIDDIQQSLALIDNFLKTIELKKQAP